ncbi:MAG: toxic anion resistance protein, partial [Holophagales bacterium]|nr:toxic anion resistance protein [Holophagales bacterium]
SRGDAKGDVGTSLADLKVEVEKADPRRFNFDPGWFSRILGYLPFIGPPLKRYFTQYESTRTVIDAIIKSLDAGRDQLKRDNVILAEDQKAMRELTVRLANAVKMGQLIDRKLATRIDTLPPDSAKHGFLSEEVVFPLRQRIIDLQQQLAVNQQGILATELISHNNKELIRGVNRAINVTSRALQVAATVAIALADQKAVLNKVESVNEVTSDLIAGTAEQLKEQGAAIQKQASSAMLDMNALKSAFADIDVAIEDLSTFRMQALPQMARTVQELDEVTARADASIRNIDSIRRSDGTIKIEV